MTGSKDTRPNATATQWRTERRYYRRSPGWGWVLGLLLIPLLFGWLGWSGLKPAPSAGVSGVTMTSPGRVVPSLDLAPLSVVRNEKDFTVTGELPDLATKDTLLTALKSLGSGVNVIDKLTVKAGVSAPDFSGIGTIFTAADAMTDFTLILAGGAVTLTGTAPSDEVKVGVEAQTKAAWANMKVVNNIAVKAASSAPAVAPAPTVDSSAVSCDGLQGSIDAALRTPIAYQKEGFSLTPATKAELSAVAAAIKACPDARISVVGHTDSTGDNAVNVPLSGLARKFVGGHAARA